MHEKIEDYTTKEGGAENAKKKIEAGQGGHYERYYTLKEKLDSGASDKEIVDLYLQMMAGKEYVDSLLKDEHFLDVVTPAKIMAYEEEWKGKKGAKHVERLNMLKAMNDGISSEEASRQYREMAQKDGDSLGDMIRRALNSVGINKDIGFDDTVNPEKILTPQIILEYEQKRKEQLTAKHKKRVDRINDKDVTENNVLAIYQKTGGGAGFMNAHELQIDIKKNSVSVTNHYDSILDYEKERRDYYKKIMDEINEPLKRVETAKLELEQEMQAANALQVQIVKYLNQSEKTHAFSSHNNFKKFTDETTGEQVQKSVENYEKKTKKLVDTAEKEEKKAEQISKMKLEGDE